jgi:hypothetical protein
MLALLDGDDEGTQRPKIRGFAAILAILLATETWCRALVLWDGYDAVAFAALALTTVAAAVSFVPGWRRTAFALLTLSQVVVVTHDFPAAGNHAYLQVALCALVALLDADEPSEQVVFLRAVRWIVCVVLAASALQKVVHGHWFDGQQLAYALWIPSFRPVLEPFLPPAEFARLAAFSGRVGEGPYVVASPLFVVLSNAVWIAELALVPLLLVRRTRVVAVAGALVFLLAIEVGAREVFFGLTFSNALLLFLPGDAHRLFVPAFATVATLLLLVRLAVLPDAVFY